MSKHLHDPAKALAKAEFKKFIERHMGKDAAKGVNFMVAMFDAAYDFGNLDG